MKKLIATALFTLCAFAAFSQESTWSNGISLGFTVPVTKIGVNEQDADDIAKIGYGIEGSYIGYHAYTKAQILLPLGSTLIIASYQIGYAGLSGMKNSELWQFSGGTAEFNGWKHNAVFSALHASDSRVNLAGIIVGMGGYLSDNALSPRYKEYEPTFTSVGIIPLVEVQISEHDSLTILSPFGNRRSFATDHEKAAEEPLLETTGSEWY